MDSILFERCYIPSTPRNANILKNLYYLFINIPIIRCFSSRESHLDRRPRTGDNYLGCSRRTVEGRRPSECRRRSRDTSCTGSGADRTVPLILWKEVKVLTVTALSCSPHPGGQGLVETTITGGGATTVDRQQMEVPLKLLGIQRPSGQLLGTPIVHFKGVLAEGTGTANPGHT